MAMTSRERVQAVLNKKTPDRVPIIVGVSNATGIKVTPYRGIKNILGIESADRYIYDWPELGTALPDERVFQRLHTDVRPVLDRLPEAVLLRNQTRAPHADFIDDWGSGQMEIEEGVWYPGVHPLPDATTIEELEAYKGWPDMDDPFRVALVKEQAARIAAEGQYGIMATPWLLFPFERAHAMQGLDKFLYNMAENPDFSKALLWKIYGYCKTLMGHFLDEIRDNIDIIKIGDDLGTQESLLISPRMYREFLKPIHADFIDFIKQKTKAKVFFHTDGDVFNLIPDFVEIGVDILNPIQTSPGKMSDLAALKSKYGDQIIFCGAIDTQHILPHGTPEEVRQEVKRVIEILGEGGGYMLASVHTIMHEVPAENVLAMVDAAVEYGTY
ncbi:MAG TPA: uroporphyrinogen decarboxylase family protein [Bellilinea sp.]|nr:uroporphyrinogen decarboxylase family protein [Bellilinea sp.]